jgi:hypothetical protein
MTSAPKITVVVPTRERCDTLAKTLATCVAQDYDALEILVSDCASRDATRDVVHGFADPRIRYVNPGESLPMARHWEFALAHVAPEGFVTYLGDDDALLERGVADIARVLADTGAPALAWLKAEYCWPDHIWPDYRDRLIVPLGNTLVRFDGTRAVRDAARFWLGYNKLPCVYNGAVPMSAVAAIRARAGQFFGAYAPDIYSGVAMLAAIDRYAYSTRPFSLNGASRHSGGTAVGTPKGDQRSARKFMQEHGAAENAAASVVMGAPASFVADALRLANERLYDGRLPLDEARTVRRVYRDLARHDAETFAALYPQLEALADRFGKRALAARLRARYRPQPGTPAPLPLGLDRRRMLVIDAASAGAKDVAAAARLVSALLPRYDGPAATHDYRSVDKLLARLAIRFARPELDLTL